MLRAIRRFDNGVLAIGNRWQAYAGFVAFVLLIGALLGAALSWARPFFPDTWGWPEAIVLGMGAACLLVVIASFALIAIRYFRPLANRPAAVGAEIDTNQPIYLAGLALWVGQLDQIPLYLVAKTAVTAERLRVFIDYEKKNPGQHRTQHSSWLGRGRVEIADLSDIVKDRDIRVPLVTTVKGLNDDALPVFGTEPGVNNKNSVGKYTVRGRVVVLGHGGDEQHYYFILLQTNGTPPFILVQGEDLYFTSDWEVE